MNGSLITRRRWLTAIGSVVTSSALQPPAWYRHLLPGDFSTPEQEIVPEKGGLSIGIVHGPEPHSPCRVGTSNYADFTRKANTLYIHAGWRLEATYIQSWGRKLSLLPRLTHGSEHWVSDSD